MAGDAALVRAVAATGGTLMFTEPGELPGDIGAVLRQAA